MKSPSPFQIFVAIGAFASAVNLVARTIINQVTSYEIAIVLAFWVGLVTAFLLNRMLVFKPADNAWHGQFLRFLLVNLAALAQVFGVSVLFARIIFPAAGFHFHADLVAHAIGLTCPLFTSYWAHKHFTFDTKNLGVKR
jgi:putative flippase GtrA